MASELLKKILDTEQDCKAKETEAAKKADAVKQKAKTDAAAVIEDARKQVEDMLTSEADAVQKSTELRLEKEKEKYRRECSELSQKAEKNRASVIRSVVQALTDQR